MKLYDILASIQVYNWYCGNITALYAWANNCALSASDIKKVRYHLNKHGYKLTANSGIMHTITKV